MRKAIVVHEIPFIKESALGVSPHSVKKQLRPHLHVKDTPRAHARVIGPPMSAIAVDVVRPVEVDAEAEVGAISINRDELLVALEYAERNYNHEQDLYWRRAAYFWTLVGAIFVGYVTVATSLGVGASFAYIRVLIVTLGLFFSFAWYLVNRGSRYWHGFWHKRVVACEEKLFDNNLNVDMDRGRLVSMTSYYPFSVTSINQILSLITFLVWVVIFVYELWKEPQIYLRIGYPVVVVVVLSALTWLSARSVSSWEVTDRR